MNNKRNAVLAAILALPAAMLAQQQPASIHGHVQNPLGAAITTGTVKLTTDRNADEKARKYQYSFPLDGTGNYKGDGVTPGTYVVILFSNDGKSVDFIDNVAIASGDNKTVDIDMTRKEFIEHMTPEEKKQLEEFKKKNAETMAANSKIANLNNLLQQARADEKAGNYDSAITAMQQATAAKPDEAILWLELGQAQLGSADAAGAAAKKAGKVPASDPDVTAKYEAAVTSFTKAKDLSAAATKKSPEIQASIMNQMGQAYARQGKVKEAGEAYDGAAQADPTKAATYYFNEAATFYNAGQTDAAAAAADKAIAADPNRAMAYYIKGQSLIGKASVDSKTNKITAPPGCVDAYQKYLELEPEGAHAEEVKGILTGIGEQIKSNFKAGAKKK